MSLAARLLNIFAIPGDVFAELRGAPASVMNWLVPVTLFALVSALAAVVLFSQPAIQQQMREQQAKVMDQQVKAGKMSQADADKFLAMSEKFTSPTMMMIFGSVAAVVMSVVRVIWWGFVLWLLSMWFLKVRLDFAKTLEVAGLATMIGVLGVIVGLLLTINLSRVGASPSLALALSDFDMTRKSHLALGAANVFSFWLVGIMATGLAKLANVPFLRAVLLVLAYWMAQESLLILVGLGQLAQ